mgnify:CR=1 FL=1
MKIKRIFNEKIHEKRQRKIMKNWTKNFILRKNVKELFLGRKNQGGTKNLIDILVRLFLFIKTVSIF